MKSFICNIETIDIDCGSDSPKQNCIPETLPESLTRAPSSDT